jgi:hypothetical protein
MSARKNTDISPKAVLDELDARVRALTERDQALLAEQISLEAAGEFVGVPKTARSSPQIDAAAMLDNGELIEIERGDRLVEIVRERAAISEAIKLAGKRGFRLRVEAEATLAGDIHACWAANIRKTVGLILDLRQQANERARLRDEYAARVGLPFNAVCGHAADKVVGQYRHADAAQAFLEAAQAAKLFEQDYYK